MRDHDFLRLFVEELGWDHAGGFIDVSVNGSVLRAERVAEKRGIQVFHCRLERLEIQNRRVLRRIEREIAKYAHEHIVVYSDVGMSRQVWQWATWMDDRRRFLHREHPFFSARPPAALIARVSRLRFMLAEEETVGLTDVLKRVSDTLDDTPDVAIFFRNPRFIEESERLANAMVTGEEEDLHRFVVFHSALARWASERYLKTNVEEDDLGQIAMMGLINAARRFDPTKEVAFSTYAVPWIRQSCQRFVPSHVLKVFVRPDLYWRFRRLRRRAAKWRRRGQEHRYRECLDRLMSKDELLGQHGHRVERAWTVHSLDSEDDALRQARLLLDPHPTPSQSAERNDQRDTVRRYVNGLIGRDRTIVRLRFGFDGEVKTLKEIGQECGLTRERVRQCVVEVLGSLRSSLAVIIGLDEEPHGPESSPPAADTTGDEGDETGDETAVARSQSSS